MTQGPMRENSALLSHWLPRHSSFGLGRRRRSRKWRPRQPRIQLHSCQKRSQPSLPHRRPQGKKTELEAGQPVSRRGRSSSPAAARVKAQPQPEDTPGAGSSTGPPRGCSAPAARRSSEPEPKTLPAPTSAAQVRMRQHKELDSAGLGKLVCWEWGHSVGGQHSVAQDPVTRCPNCGLRTLLDLKRFVPVAHGAVPVLRRSSDKPGEGQPENTEDWQGVPQSLGSVPTVVL